MEIKQIFFCFFVISLLTNIKATNTNINCSQSVCASYLKNCPDNCDNTLWECKIIDNINSCIHKDLTSQTLFAWPWSLSCEMR